MKFIFSILVAGLCLFVFPPGANAKTQDAVWPTKEFEVKWYSPLFEDELFRLRPWLVKALLSDEEKERLLEWDEFVKNSMREIATYYDSAGLQAPNLPIETGEDGVRRYVVYAYDFKDGFITTETEEFAKGYYRGFCNPVSVLFPESVDLDPSDDKLALNVNELRKIKVSHLSRNARQNFYSTMAHELFHAIQFSYDAEYSSILVCKQTNGYAAVLEGTATAAAALATDDKFDKKYIKSLSWSNINLGVFPYGGLEEFLKVKSDVSATAEDERALQYKTSSFWRYLAERFADGEVKYGVGKVFNTLFTKPLGYAGAVNPTLAERYKWLNGGVQAISGKPLYILFPEFTAEFGSHVTARYQGDHKEWAEKVFRLQGAPCRPVEIDGSGDKAGEIEISIEDELTRNSATCMNLKWTGVSEFARIEIQAEHFSAEVIDQLHLGVPYYNGGGKPENCFKKIRARAKPGDAELRNLECSFGKVFPKRDDKGNVIKTWKLGTKTNRYGEPDFFARGLGGSGNATLVLTNMATVQGETKDIPLSGEKLIIRFSIEESEFADGRKFLPPDQIQLRDPAGILGGNLQQQEIPWWNSSVRYGFLPVLYMPLPDRVSTQDIPVPDRYNIYGIKKKADALPGGLGTSFQVVSVDDAGKKYTILPIGGEFKFEFTGKVNAVVTNEDSATSVLCNTMGEMPPPVMDVTKSDETQLRFSIKTDLCKMKPNRRIEVVDKIDAKFVYAFGRRAYPDTAPQDMITPGLELYIDEYLKELVRQGVPLPSTVLMSDGSVPGDYDGDGIPDNAPTSDPSDPGDNPGDDPGDDPNNKTNETGVCDCSCEKYKEIMEMAKNAPRTQAGAQKMRSMMACIQVCATQYGKCKN